MSGVHANDRSVEMLVNNLHRVVAMRVVESHDMSVERSGLVRDHLHVVVAGMSSGDTSHVFVSSEDSNLSGADGSLGSTLGNLSRLGTDDGNLGNMDEVLGVRDGSHSSVVVDSSDSVGSGDDLKVLVSDGVSDSGVLLSSDDDSVVNLVVHDDCAVVVVMVVDGGSLVGDFVETELTSIFGPVSLSSLGHGSSSGVKGSVFAEGFGRLSHLVLVFLQLGLLKDGKRLSVGTESHQDLLLERSAEGGTVIDSGGMHDLLSVSSELGIEFLNNLGFLVGELSGMELLEVLGSDGSKLLGFDFASVVESLVGLNHKVSLVLSDLFVDDDESLLTELHRVLSGGSDLFDVGGVSGLGGLVYDFELASVGRGSGYGVLLEGGKLGGRLTSSGVFDEVDTVLNFTDVLGRLLDPELSLNVSFLSSLFFVVEVVSMEGDLLVAELRVGFLPECSLSSVISSDSAGIVSHSTSLKSVFMHSESSLECCGVLSNSISKS